MVNVWPPGLPQNFEIGSYSEGFGDDLLESQPDVGPPITRLRSTSSARPVSGTMVLTTAQISTFKTFFSSTILRGALPFYFPAQVDPVGSPDVGWLVKFLKGSQPKWSPLGGDLWRITLSLVILP